MSAPVNGGLPPGMKMMTMGPNAQKQEIPLPEGFQLPPDFKPPKPQIPPELDWFRQKAKLPQTVKPTQLFEKLDDTLVYAQAMALNVHPSQVDSPKNMRRMNFYYKASQLGVDPVQATEEMVDKALVRKILNDSLPRTFRLSSPQDWQQYWQFANMTLKGLMEIAK